MTAVEEWIVFELCDRESDSIEGIMLRKEIVVRGGDDGEEGGMVLLVEVGWQVGGCDITCSTVNDETGLDFVNPGEWSFIFHLSIRLISKKF